MKWVALITGLLAAYNSMSKEDREQLGETLGQIPDVARKVLTGQTVDLSALKPVLTSEQMEAEFEKREHERLNEG